MPNAAFTARITDFTGARRTVTLSAPESDAVIDTALLFDGDTITASGDRRGTLTITRTLSHPAAATATRTIVLELADQRRPTDRQHEDLALISEWEEHHPEGAVLTPEGAARTRFERVTPGRTQRLLAAGWLTPGGRAGGHVRVSYAGRVAAVLHEHRLRTGTVGTEAWASGAVWGGWVPCPPLYVSMCGCGWRSPHRSEDPGIARSHGRSHRQGRLQALFTA
ncbi:hypothetical protein LN042_23090 [Kitasatospora sp. RB6PN24]|uniref:hypothetical protein n=1 Tax=Kitasatospora humi TaxID=2893891 RepID=UPI001E5E219C|nr:hypothetical protein [Kitasatospora humi]MCC9309922.1 hypothetical protein [Kitasatospora humi]